MLRSLRCTSFISLSEVAEFFFALGFFASPENRRRMNRNKNQLRRFVQQKTLPRSFERSGQACQELIARPWHR